MPGTLHKEVQEQKREELHMNRQAELHKEQTFQAEPIQQHEQIEEEIALNQELNELARGKYEIPKATAMATGRIQGDQLKSKRSFKQRCQDKRLDAKMKKKYGTGDHVTCHILEGAQSILDKRTNSVAAYKETSEQKNIDIRVLRGFSLGYKLKNGQPATPRDAAAKEADDEFLTDYVSCDVKRRWRHLDRMVDDVMKSKLHLNMLDPECMARNFEEYKTLADRTVYMENVLKDKINKPYFDRMAPEKLKKLENLITMGKSAQSIFAGMLPAFAAIHGVESNKGELEMTPELIEGQREVLNGLLGMFKLQLEAEQ